VNIHDYGEAHIAHMLPTFAPANLPKWFDGADPYVLLSDSRIIATGTLRGTEIQTVFVDPTCHGKGFGKRIMVHLEQLAKVRGVAEITLKSSLSSLAFYERLGYQEIAETHGSVGGRMIVMKKTL